MGPRIRKVVMPTSRPPLMSRSLPPDVRDALVAASKQPDEFSRAVAIQAATERAQIKYPHLFKE